MDANPPTVTTALSPWDERIGKFATLTGAAAVQISEALKSLVGDPSDAALVVLSDPNAVLDSDLQTALVSNPPKIPLGIFRKHLLELRGPQIKQEVSTGYKPAGFDPLPAVPDDASFLASLKVGGLLKVGPIEVISAMKAAIANNLGLYELPDVLAKKMETFAESIEEPVDENFFRLNRLITSRDYADVLSVLNVKGSFVTAGRRSKFLDRLDTELWPELVSFHKQVVAWQNTWMAGMSNPGAAMSMMLMATSGHGGPMPAGMMAPPDTAPVRDSAEAFVNTVNGIFGGFGIPVARALAYDATRIKEVLEDASLPAALGTVSKDQMLKTLGVAVSADYVRTERDVTRFALAVMELSKVGAGNEEVAYITALFQLGSSIQWDKLPGGTGRSGIGTGTGASGRRL